MMLKNIARISLIAAALALPASAWAAVTTTAVAVGTSAWVDLGTAATIVTIQSTRIDIIVAIADTAPGTSPPVGFHLPSGPVYQWTLATPSTTHLWAIQSQTAGTQGGIGAGGGYIIIAK